jgi:hypothetical protein
MFNLKLGALCALAALAITSPAAATVYTITIPGQITVQNSGIATDMLHVGDNLTMTTTFDDANYVVWGSQGYNAFGGYGLSTSGDFFWRIDGAGQTWASGMDIHDGGFGSAIYWDDIGSKRISGPIIVFTDTDVLSVFGPAMYGYGDTTHNALYLGGTPWIFPGAQQPFNALPINSTFSLTQPDGHFADQVYSFAGAWDFASATVTIGAPVPEPSTWAMLILGFGMAGGAMRYRRSARYARTALVR